MTDLIHTEKDLVTSLKDYIKAEESKLEQIKKYIVASVLVFYHDSVCITLSVKPNNIWLL